MRVLRRSLGILFLGVTLWGCSAFNGSIAPSYSDLIYAVDSPSQKLDLYLPTVGKGPFPVVVIIHGGGFRFGDKADAESLVGLNDLLAAGYAVASINYRLSDEATYPAQIFDAKTAVRFLRAGAKEYSLQANRIGVWGASAGGNLAAMLGTTCGVAALEGEQLGYAQQSSCVQAVVDWFGPIEFLTLDAQFAGTDCPQDHDAADSFESKLMGAPIQAVPERVAMANPMNFIDAADPPFFIQNGSADCNIPPIQHQRFAEALRAALGADNVTHIVIEGAGHGGSPFETSENVQGVIDFLDRHLK